jgi:NAD(P)H-hydrate epimerase
MSVIPNERELPRLPPRRTDAHKGDFGRLLVIAGSRGMSGAAVLCGSAALRGGAGLVTVATPESAWPVVAGGNPCYMTLPLPEAGGKIARAAVAALEPALRSADVVAVGPGLGRSAEVAAVVQHLLAEFAGPMVVDADGLNALGCPPEALRGHPGPRVLTPHPGEFARLTGTDTAEVQSRREEMSREFAAGFGVTLVLKGANTLITAGEEQYRNDTGNPGMATAGAGDVLTGLVAALLAQKLAPLAAARLAVYAHGRAGDRAMAALGGASLVASDLLDYLPRALRD